MEVLKLCVLLKMKFLYSSSNLITKERSHNTEKQFYNYVPKKKSLQSFVLFLYFWVGGHLNYFLKTESYNDIFKNLQNKNL